MAKSGGGQSQADRHLPEAVQSMKNLPVSALACGMFHSLCLVSACVSVCARACVSCVSVCVCVCVCVQVCLCLWCVCFCVAHLDFYCAAAPCAGAVLVVSSVGASCQLATGNMLPGQA